jgi:hypothetical protein
MNGEKNKTIICKPMETSKLLGKNYTKAFTIYKEIFKGHLQK